MTISRLIGQSILLRIGRWKRYAQISSDQKATSQHPRPYASSLFYWQAYPIILYSGCLQTKRGYPRPLQDAERGR